MAQPSVINGEQILILIEMVGASGTFTHPCLINTDRGITFGSSTNQEVVPDCDNPSDPAWVSTEVDGLNATISGSGIHDVASTEAFFDWYSSGEGKLVRVKQNRVGGSTFEGTFKLTEYNFSGGRKAKVTGGITLVSDGVITRSDNA